MSGLRILALSYLASAGLFCLAATYAAHPDLGEFLAGSRLDTGAAVTIDIAPPDDARAADGGDRFTDLAYSATVMLTILPDLTPPAGPELAQPYMPPAAAPQFDIARPSLSPRDLASARAVAVARRLKESLTPQMLKAFDLFVYVSKADHGPLAQRMYVFRKQRGRKLALLHDWPASTGRERREISPHGRRKFTATPRGYYELDPRRMYRSYRSWTWDQPMPYAMFFDWKRRGSQTGLAIHAASAGCVHLSPGNARTLYELIRSEYRGLVPRFAYDPRTQTMSNDGTLMRDAKGHLKMADGYKVLVRIEDYAGDASIAALF
ncbi:MAG: L,D-transpeptidase [Alphaproteobacteria bacterium]|nr:L,D-transpeptidase [Alphaproteobacteria bacterium]